MNRLADFRTLRLALICIVATAATACANRRGGSIAYEPQGFGVPDAPRATVSQENYRVAPGDTLTITVFQVEDLSRDYVVDSAGHIAMPLIGNVEAVGFTTEELRTRVAQRLAERYLRNPDVTVAIKESASRVVTVDGAVAQPGVFPVTGPMTLIQAVAQARGPTENANPRRVAIFRRIGGQRMAAAFDLVDIRRGLSPDPDVYAGDIVVVDGSGTRAMWRDIIATLPVLSLFRPY